MTSQSGTCRKCNLQVVWMSYTRVNGSPTKIPFNMDGKTPHYKTCTVGKKESEESKTRRTKAFPSNIQFIREEMRRCGYCEKIGLPKRKRVFYVGFDPDTKQTIIKCLGCGGETRTSSYFMGL